MNLLIIIDLQAAFINENTKEAPAEIKKLMTTHHFDKIMFTKFVNSLTSPVYINIKWDKCLTEESKKILLDTRDCPVLSKETYSVFTPELKNYLKNNNIKKIYLCGIDIECCVLVSALNLFENNYDVYVLKDYCYSMSSNQARKNVIAILKRNIGKDRVI